MHIRWKLSLIALFIFKLGELLCPVKKSLMNSILLSPKSFIHGQQVQIVILTDTNNNTYIDYSKYFQINLCTAELQFFKKRKELRKSLWE